MQIETLESAEPSGRKTLVFRVNREFDYLAVPDARKAFDTVKNDNIQVVVDMKETAFIDSSGLGFLLMMHYDLPGGDDSFKIVNCQPHIRRVFERAQFQQIIDIE